MPNRVGQQLGNYRLLKYIGDGAFAEVYLGEHIHLGTQAAIKVLTAQLTSQDEQKFREEARTIARLVHPHIVRVLEFGIEGKIPYLIMDYAPNGTLRDRHASNTPVPLNIVVTYVKQIADALQYAHDAKLIHRDVKPENLLIGHRNEILLSDFGIAVVAHSTCSQVLEDKIGTILYMAPEQIKGYPRPASDQYALGIIAYEWLAGMCPFDGPTHEIIAKHLQTPPPSLLARVPTLPPLIEQAIFKALRKDPKTRFANIQAFANALEQSRLQSANTVYPPVVQPGQQSKVPLPPTILVAPIPNRRVGTSICSHAGHAGHFSSWSPDGKYIASGNRKMYAVQNYLENRANVEIWDATTGRNVSNYFHGVNVYHIAWSPDGKWLASASDDKAVEIRVPDSGKLEFTYAGHFGPVNKIAWAPDSRLIASAANGNEVHIWDMLSGYTISTYRDAWLAAWSPNGAYLALAIEDGIKLLNTNALSSDTQKKMYQQVSAIQKLAWSPTSNHLAAYCYNRQGIWGIQNEQIQIWDIAKKRPIFSYEASGMEWSPDGRFFATWRTSKPEVQIWDVSTHKNIFTYSGHKYSVQVVVWSPNGKRIASKSNDGTVQIWSPTGEGNVYIHGGHTGEVTNVSYSPDGSCILSAAVDGIQVWAAD